MADTISTTSKDGTYGTLRYFLAALSFIPLIGILFGLIAIGLGLLNRRRPDHALALVGAAGIIGLTVLPYGALLYFGEVQRGGIYDGLRLKLAQHELNTAVELVERYKVNNGEYPDSLEQLKSSLPANSDESKALSDPRYMRFGEQARLFYYQKVDSSHYYLRGIAPDGKPFSPGALVPQIDKFRPPIGLLVSPP